MSRLTRLSLQTLTQEAGNSLAKYCPQLESLQLRTTNTWMRSGTQSRREDQDEEEDYSDDIEDEDWENPAGHDKNDNEEETNGEEDEDKETKAARRQEQLQDHLQYIYDVLGRWAELRVLELGVDNVDWYDILGGDPGSHLVDGRVYYNHFGPTPNTLPLSLESGLDQLRMLKKLKVIGFEGVDHRINTEELAWMAEYWPQLQVMHGLQAPDDKDEYALLCPKIDELRVHMQVLRPLVRHEPGRK
ncbi:hypothetical protein BGZ96_005715 [Linnemannia gamsii]|uniref:F-box domain-containing protein n=1 Tax=Linnemannia gamsii TaxID=64522 RepID=A0ABQ7K494_9FUNG|nr:hypothetical protein BGZ96_005715 [Linnemannia gamsii]